MLRYNAAHGIRLFRISSDVIPFGSHPINQVPWWEEEAPRLAAIGSSILETDARVSMHPGQFCVLSSPRPEVLDGAVRDLEYHARFLDALGLPSSHKVVVHVGGTYGDKPAAIERWGAAARALHPNVRARLIVENDERLFGVEDALAAARFGGVPVVFDVHHHRVYTGRLANAADPLPEVFATWNVERDGVPKIHYSSQAPDKRPGAHANYVDSAELAAFLAETPPGSQFDCMLEAKAKDLALLRVRTELGIDA